MLLAPGTLDPKHVTTVYKPPGSGLRADHIGTEAGSGGQSQGGGQLYVGGAAKLALEERFCEARLANDARERASLKLGMIRNGHGRRCVSRPLLHDDMTATLSNGCKSLGLKNLAHLTAGQDAQLTQPRPRLA